LEFSFYFQNQGGKHVGINPKINNMSQGYEVAKYELFMISDAGLKSEVSFASSFFYDTQDAKRKKFNKTTHCPKLVLTEVA
jgi:hypothetical protein